MSCVIPAPAVCTVLLLGGVSGPSSKLRALSDKSSRQQGPQFSTESRQSVALRREAISSKCSMWSWVLAVVRQPAGSSWAGLPNR